MPQLFARMDRRMPDFGLWMHRYIRHQNEIEWFEAFPVCTLVSFYVLFTMHVVLYLNTVVQWEIVMNAGRFETWCSERILL